MELSNIIENIDNTEELWNVWGVNSNSVSDCIRSNVSESIESDVNEACDESAIYYQMGEVPCNKKQRMGVLGVLKNSR